MTLQERYSSEQAAARDLNASYQQARAQLVQLEQSIIRADERMALLEVLIREQAPVVPLVAQEGEA
jgi:hypothetical protein